MSQSFSSLYEIHNLSIPHGSTQALQLAHITPSSATNCSSSDLRPPTVPERPSVIHFTMHYAVRRIGGAV